VETPGYGPRPKKKKKSSRLPYKEPEGIPMEEDSLPEPDYDNMDIQYEYSNLQLDVSVVPLNYTPPKGYLEGYWVSSDSASPNLDDDSDEEKVRISELVQSRSP
jgi:hypothetical protein